MFRSLHQVLQRLAVLWRRLKKVVMVICGDELPEMATTGGNKSAGALMIGTAPHVRKGASFKL
jgi:hypothetical protein